MALGTKPCAKFNAGVNVASHALPADSTNTFTPNELQIFGPTVLQNDGSVAEATSCTELNKKAPPHENVGRGFILPSAAIKFAIK